MPSSRSRIGQGRREEPSDPEAETRGDEGEQEVLGEQHPGDHPGSSPDGL